MIYTEMTIHALNFAFKAHSGQLDRSGLPYIFHPYHLAEQMTDEITCAAALLHDVVEDTDITLADLEEEGFPERVIEAVRLMTHEDGVDYFDYIKMLKLNPDAKAVKLADLAHNMDMTRLPEITERDIRKQEKYRRAEEILLSECF